MATHDFFEPINKVWWF